MSDDVILPSTYRAVAVSQALRDGLAEVAEQMRSESRIIFASRVQAVIDGFDAAQAPASPPAPPAPVAHELTLAESPAHSQSAAPVVGRNDTRA